VNKSDLQKLFDTHGIRPNKRLGQCFLIDDNLAGWIVRQLDPQPEDVVVEVGPGAGALTRHLYGKVRRLILIEMDRKLAELLKERFPEAEVIEADAVQYDHRSLFLEGGVKLIGNLPYSSGSEILRNFLTQPSPVSEAVVMIQKEVAGRICAEPRSKEYGVMSLALQSEWVPRILKTVGAEPFSPRPAVDSSILRVDPRPAGELPEFCARDFSRIVKGGFSQRRKQLRKNLQVEPADWEPIASELKVSATVRAEELSLRQWIALSNRIAPHPSCAGGQSADEIFDVVDENDEVIGQKTRAEVHREKLLHRAVHIFVFNRQGELFLQKRSHLKDSHPGRWDSSASGHLDSGEDYAESAARELEEELGVPVKEKLSRVGKLPAGEKTDQEFVEVFACRTQGKIRTHGSEVACGGFFPLSLVDRWVEERPGDFATAFIECFRLFREKVPRQ